MRAHAWPEAVPAQLFELVLTRDHCKPASAAAIAARGGNPWDTVKPLAHHFPRLDQVLLIDDSPHKAAADEAPNMIVMPGWAGPGAGKGDSALPVLVEALLDLAATGQALAAAGKPVPDLRRHSGAISARLAALAVPATELRAGSALEASDDASSADPASTGRRKRSKAGITSEFPEVTQADVDRFADMYPPQTPGVLPEWAVQAAVTLLGHVVERLWARFPPGTGIDRLNNKLDTNPQLRVLFGTSVRRALEACMARGSLSMATLPSFGPWIALGGAAPPLDPERDVAGLFAVRRPGPFGGHAEVAFQPGRAADPVPEEQLKEALAIFRLAVQRLLGAVHPAPPARRDAGGGQRTLTPLHAEVLSFARQAAPTRQEVGDMKRALMSLAEVATRLWPHSQTMLFGSQATGLTLPGGDLDVVILGVGSELDTAGSGFSARERQQKVQLLEDLLDALLATKLLQGRVELIDARVPIIKCCMAAAGGLHVDISLGTANGAAAARYVRAQVLAIPPLRPLCLVIKALLRQKGFNQVFTGGISSYSLCNMVRMWVLAYLQSEGYKLGEVPGDPGEVSSELEGVFAFLTDLHCEGLHGESAGPGPPGASTADLGRLLWGFCNLFGYAFRYSHQAVSPARGGICKKIGPWRQDHRGWLLAVEDPQQMGKDIGSGSYEIRAIREMFAEVADKLGESLEDLAAQRQARGCQPASPPPLLPGIVDMVAAVARGASGLKARRALEAQQTAKSAEAKRYRSQSPRRSYGRHRPWEEEWGKRLRSPSPPSGEQRERPYSGRTPYQPQRSSRHTPLPRLTPKGKAGPKPKATPQPSAAHKPTSGGKGKGTKRARAVEAQWSNKKGQFLESRCFVRLFEEKGVQGGS
ncbi:Poly(A) RNA polymerase protein 2 [Auxenochlorella protothecoides]|uniref:Poly(A) RNA polymerase protein 2 n=1 Tax=Auxenochlorella protothecoides TaxID=3075 RepID=A0A087SH76_AUXPR|nr:Poly(A) RNA polymerase protein 2 [Auxenochlorella protothecoides]KFM25080.1 Poly(A) RNA polymerase protein 2 [Auxenochlorella protothecoides]